jgi:Kef-type K+ transport system membrane component KefB
VLGLSRLVGGGMERIGQPFVVGEMLAGILLGPSMLGAVWPGAYLVLFPPGSVRFLGAVSQLGLILFMFLVGLELRTENLRGRGFAALLSSHSSIVTPLFFGAALALVVYPRLGVEDVGFAEFALFLGAAMSVTAFPVLARILSERGLRDTKLGSLALACAAVDDVTAWCVLAIVVAIARGDQSPVAFLLTLAGALAFVAAMFVVVRPRLARFAARRVSEGTVSRNALVVIVLVALTSAWITQQIGIHALFGAFLAGVVMPKEHAFVTAVAKPFEDVLFVVLLPLFFAATGIRTSLSLFGTAEGWALLGLVIGCAVAGKVGGSAIAARVAGVSWPESFALGALMNTRGLMGLVIVQVGAEIGVVSPSLFAMLVLMSIATTMMTTPALRLLPSFSRS